MGSLGKDNGEIKPSEINSVTDFPHSETQPCEIDYQFPIFGDEADNEYGDELNYLQSTVPYDDDNVPVEDGFDTQVLNLGGETQVLNFDCETQVLDDLDFFENMEETQFLDEFDDEIALDSEDEGTEGTVILDHADEVSNDDILTSDCGQSLGQEEKNESLEQYNTSKDEQIISSGIRCSTETPNDKAVSKSGSVRRFTSIRAASLRASGLAARNAALRGMNKESCFIRTDSQISDHCTVDINGLNPNFAEKINEEHHQDNYDANSISLRHGSNCRVSCSTARKLFAESPCSSENADATENVIQFPAFEGSLAGLSYINSQEPGELSQANALNFVEKFVNDNMMELDDEDDLGKSTGGKSKLISSALIGPRGLVKKTIERSTAGETKIFDWDDALEDEGGGYIYCKRKEEFYGNRSRPRKTSNRPHKPKGKKLDESHKEQQISHNIVVLDSVSKSLQCKSTDNDKPAVEGQMDFRNNLFNEFDEQRNLDSSKQQLETAAAEELNVGFDTQIAAEAMEALFYGEAATDQSGSQGIKGILKGSSKGSFRGKSRKRISSREPTSREGVSSHAAAPVTRQSKRTRETSFLQDKRSKNPKDCDTDLLPPRTKKAKSNTDKNQVAGVINTTKMPSKSINQRKAGGVSAKSQLHGTGRSTRGSLLKKRCSEEFYTTAPIAHRTRQSLVMNKQTAESPASGCRKGKMLEKEAVSLQENRTGSTDGRDVELSLVSTTKGKLSKMRSNQSREHGNVKLCNNDELNSELMAGNNGNHGLSYPKHRRSSRKMPVHVGEPDTLEAQSAKSIQPDDNGQSIPVVKRSRRNSRSTCIPSITTRITRSSRNTCPALHFSDQNPDGKLSHQSSDKQGSREDVTNCNYTEMNRRISMNVSKPEAAKEIQYSSGNQVAVSSPIAKSSAVNVAADKSPEEKSRSLGPLCTTPVNCPTPINAASPVCMGEEYFKQSCKKNLSKASLIKELRGLSPIETEPISPSKDLRKRRDLTNVRVLFSNHLDEDIIKQQKKILARLGISEASSILNATHFITDKFVRTRNMLEAIASGKPVVTHLWLESIGQVNIHIDEEAYILRDIKKERDFGFCLPASLARARKRPLLQGRRVLITPNTKPSKETIVHLVTAVHGQAIERIGRSRLKDEKVPDDLLVLSCEEDYEICVPFLEKGAAVYSSELLLNGIVTQKLDYERHRIFADHVRKTRSTIWLRKDNKFLPVTKHK